MEKSCAEISTLPPKSPFAALLGGQVYILKVTVFESFGEDAFAVSIELAPTLDPSIAPSFTAKQGQYLAFVYNYTKIYGQPPAESDLERYFRVSPPAIHEMIKTLERNGLIARIPGQARSMRLRLQPKDKKEWAGITAPIYALARGAVPGRRFRDAGTPLPRH